MTCVATDMEKRLEDPRSIIAREPMHYRQVVAVGIATALNGLDGFDILSISFAAPGISRAWHIDRAALGLVLSMELVGMGVGALILGVVADRIGRRPTILGCLVVMALGMALAATANSVGALSVWRLLTGVGIGGMLAATAAIAAECSNARRRNLSVAIMAGGYPVGAIIGGVIATTLLARTGEWRMIFEVGSVMTCAFIPLVLAYVPETISFLAHRQPPGALVRINRTMVRQGRAPLTELPPRQKTISSFSVARAFAPGMAGTTSLLIVAYFLHMVSFYFFIKWIPKDVVDMGFAPAAAGSVLVWGNVGSALGCLAISLATQRISVRNLTVGAMIAGSLAIAYFGQEKASLVHLSIVAVVGGFFANAATSGLYAVIAQSFPADMRAGGTGLVIGIGRGGAALGSIGAGLLYTAGWGLPAVAIVLGAGTLLAGLLLATLRYKESAIA